MQATIEIADLTQEDKKKIKKNLLIITISGFVFVAFVALMFSQVLGEARPAYTFFFIALGIVVLFFGGVLFYFSRDLISGKKSIVRGKVESKRIDISKSSSSSKHSNRTSTTRRYYISIDGKEYNVDVTAYNQIRAGNVVEIHNTMKNKEYLSHLILDNNGEESSDQPTYSANQFSAFQPKIEVPKEQLKQLPLEEGDKKAIRRAYQGGIPLLFGLFFCTFPLIFIVIGVATKLYAFMIIPFIFIAVGVFMVRSNIMNRIKKRSDIKSGQKEVFPSKVRDKTSHSTNGDRQNYQIVTFHGVFPVSLEKFDMIEVGETVLLQRTIPHQKVFDVFIN